MSQRLFLTVGTACLLSGLRVLPGWAAPTNAVAALALIPDGTILASGSFDHTIKTWDLASGKELHTLRKTVLGGLRVKGARFVAL